MARSLKPRCYVQAKHDTLPFCNLDEAARTFVLPKARQVGSFAIVVASCSGAGESALLVLLTRGRIRWTGV